MKKSSCQNSPLLSEWAKSSPLHSETIDDLEHVQIPFSISFREDLCGQSD